jgi:hypothetical protein
MELDTSYLFTSSKHQTWGLNFSEDGPAMTLQNGRDRQNDGNVNGGKCMEKCFFDHQSFLLFLRFSDIQSGWLRSFLHQLLDVSSHYYPMIPPSSPVANCVRSKMFHQVLALRLPLRKMCRQLRRDGRGLEEFFLLGNPLGEVVFWVFPLTLW